ncbi:hypothetical protein PVAP13_4KG075400 [Panicum virgatum]|uniref:Uncharacterized protein n=1 Tax=Panicum virgatum TaxID=38727 RepID=A0A8T0TJQ2_PANVG|nr:hypothetical protein PVAP13_4KG075400 [Panicum virgatum]
MPLPRKISTRPSSISTSPHGEGRMSGGARPQRGNGTRRAPTHIVAAARAWLAEALAELPPSCSAASRSMPPTVPSQRSCRRQSRYVSAASRALLRRRGLSAPPRPAYPGHRGRGRLQLLCRGDAGAEPKLISYE